MNTRLDQDITRFSLTLLIGICLLAAVLACSDQGVNNDAYSDDEPEHRTPASLTETEKELLSATNEFGIELFRRVISDESQDENVFISPLSASMALGMAYNGAVGNTQEEMRTALRFSLLAAPDINEAYRTAISLLVNLDPDVTMTIANSIWAREGTPLKPSYEALCREYFDARVSELDFSQPAAADTINGWVSDNTGGLIDKLVDKPLDPNIVCLLINAIHFKAAWQLPFNPDSTEDGTFYHADGSISNCRMMQREAEFDVLKKDDFYALNLPYGDSSFCMMIILPDSGRSTQDVATQFSDENWHDWTSEFYTQWLPVNLPRFKIEYEITLNSILQDMGMPTAFTPAADFSNMIDGGGIWIDKVKQQAVVEVNEEGTEAAAATVVVMVDSLPLPFEADRPFLFVIYERVSKTIIFAGRVAIPESD